MKKVLIICGKLYIGGAEKVAYSIGHYRDKSKYECHYLVFGEDEGAYEPQLVMDGCEIIHMDPPSTDYRKFSKELDSLMKKQRYDVVHCHTMFNSGIVLLIAKLNNVPCRIAHSHSICSGVKRSVVKRIYERMMRILILCTATHYVTCGRKAGEWLYGKKQFDKKGILILNGIDTGTFQYSEDNRKKIRKKHGLENKFVLGHAGHLVTVKNQKFLINLMPQILEKNPDSCLLLLGDGRDREILENQVEQMNLTNSVIFTGNVSNVNEYLSAMDVFVFPSLYEGMPLALMEVQSNGLPCIISDAIPKDVYLTDLIVPLSLQQSVKDWVNEICRVRRIDPEKYSKFIYDSGYDTEMMVKKIYNIYEE